MGAGTTVKGGIELVETFLKELNKPAKAAAKAAPQDEALRLAQQRAALPPAQGGLGLPANNTPEQRAKAMAWNTPGFHATNADIKKFDPNLYGASDYGSIGQGVYIDPSKSAGYANLVASIVGKDKTANVMPLLVREGNVFNADQLPLITNAKTSKEVSKNLKKLGYDSVMSEVNGQPNEMVVFDPDRVRSRFAAFDPFRRDAATAAFFGVAAPDLLAKEREKATGGEVHMMGGGRPPKKTTLEEDLKSFKDPALALADMLAGALRGTTTAATGFAGDMEELYRQYGKGAIANAVRQLFPTREGKATTLPTIEEMNAMLPPVVPTGAGRSSQVADIGQFLGENNPAAPTAIAAVKPVVKVAAKGVLDLARSEPARRAGNRVAQAAGVAPMRIVPESTVSVGQVIKGAQDILPTAEREANLAKFLKPSAEKRRMYHGSKEPNIKEFKTRKDLTDDYNMTGHYADERDAVFLAPEPEFTTHFSKEGYTDANQAPTTYPVYVQVENPFDFDNPEHLNRVKETYLDMYHNPESDLYDPHLLPSERSMAQHRFNKKVDALQEDKNNWPKIENAEFQEVLKDLGFDSFYTRERGSKNLGVYDPSRIKSALGNRGTYDIGEPDINKAKGGAVMMADGGMITIEEFLRKQGY